MHEHFDSQRAFEYITGLSGYRRLPGTPGEADARDYIIQAGEDIGVEMRAEGFNYSAVPFSVMLPSLYLFISLLCIAGSLTYLWAASFAAVPGAAVLLASCLSMKWSEANERFATWVGPRESANLVGEIRAASGSKGTLILSAHYDSKSQLMPSALKAALFAAGFCSAVVLGLALFAGGMTAAGGRETVQNPAVFYLSLVPAVLICALVFDRTGNKSPGARDDASGEAVILETARLLARRPPENLDVLIISFACEEIGLIGSIKYLQAHGEDLKEKNLFMLNFDTPFSAAGFPGINTGFGIPPRRTGERLNGLSLKAAGEMGFEIKGIFLPLRAAADHIPWSRHGFEATGFVSTSARMHRSSDSPEGIDREALRRTGEVALSVIRELDRQIA